MTLLAFLIASLWYAGLYNVGMLLAAKAVRFPSPEEVFLGFGPPLFRFTYGRTQYHFGAVPGGGCKFPDDASQNRKLAYIVVHLAGPGGMLLVGSVLAYFGALGGIDVLDAPGALVTRVEPQIRIGGLRPNDVVLKADGKTVRWGKDLALCLAEWKAGPMTLECERAGEIIAVELRREELQPRDGVLTCRSRVVTRTMTPAECLAELPNLWWQSGRRILGWRQAVAGTTWSNIDAPQVGDFLPSAGDSTRFGTLLFFGLMGIHVGIWNLLPIPPMVGYHAVIMAYEVIVKKNIRESTRTVLAYIGLAVILVLSGWFYWGLLTSLWRQPAFWNTARNGLGTISISVRF